MPQALPTEIAAKRDRMLALIQQLGSCAVAYSGGVDSAVVAQAAQLALGDRAIAVTAASASLAEDELTACIALARQIGIRHEVIATDEFANPAYVANHADRCYYCKSELYSQLDRLVDQFNVATVLNGANFDDRGDHRPGMVAAVEHRVRSPLLECDLTKDEVRQLAADWSLPVWDKPASPCLSSRIAYGEEVTHDRVRMIDRAEQFLRSTGLRELRVRYHRGDMARIEVPLAAIERLALDEVREALVERFKELGFKYVTLDLEGFRSGSLNEVLPVESLRLAGELRNG